jgi:hypothetical protein
MPRRWRAGLARDLVHRGEHGRTLAGEQVLHAAAADRFAEIGLGAVLAGQEAGGEPVIGQRTHVPFDAIVLQLALEPVAADQVVFGLQHVEAGQAGVAGEVVGRLQARSAEVGCAEHGDLAGPHQLGEGGEIRLLRRRLVVLVGIIEVDLVDA